MKIAIYTRGFDVANMMPFQSLVTELRLRKIEIFIYENLVNNPLNKFGLLNGMDTFNEESLDSSFDCLISLGGDGTILDAAAFIGSKNVPILGINFGRLGFLAPFGKEDIRILVEALFSRQYRIDSRSLLHVDANIPIFTQAPFALNELVIQKCDSSSMIQVLSYLNGEPLNTYWADGLIISTPTGSTGYSLSCGGPIIFPQSEVFAITPISPHHLNARPIIIPNHFVISLEVESRADSVTVSVDARRETVSSSIQLALKKESFCIKLIRLNENSYLETLKKKLAWGFDSRN